MGNLPDDFMFSQSSLQDYADCARRFELKYLIKQRFPAPEVDDMLAFEHRMAQGQQFHLLVHQHLLGIPADLLQQRINDAEVAEWFSTYLKNGLDDVPEKCYPEKTLTIPLDKFGLLAKVDLLAIDDSNVQIIDWKTSRYLPKQNQVKNRWQTRVYRYVVAKGAGYLHAETAITPEQIQMSYWYAAHDGKRLNFPYNHEQMQQDEADLLQLIHDIDNTSVFPLTDDERQCRFCTYRSLCDRGTQAGSISDYDEDFDHSDTEIIEINFEQIAEIQF
ncbi:MAG: PD-(D/E)XK nuclease family protein [Phototrophicaceae bacterium]